MKYHYIRSNVRVKFEHPSDPHAKCYLQYRIPFLVLFKRWVTVNYTYYDCHGDFNNMQLDMNQMVSYLSGQGQDLKYVKIKNRQLERDINRNAKGR